MRERESSWASVKSECPVLLTCVIEVEILVLDYNLKRDPEWDSQ